MLKHLRRKAHPAFLALLMALPAAQAFGAITSRHDDASGPTGWSAVAGMEPRAVREMARELPLSEQATRDQPWCGQNTEVEASLTHDFGETKVTTNARDTALWGSQIMGTWTVVLERADATSCIIASGVGFRDGTSPQAYFTNVGLNG